MARIQLEFDRMPSTLLGFVRAGLGRKRGLARGGAIPAMHARLGGFRPDPRHVRRYAALCGDQAETRLPLAYPHVLAAPLHLALMTHADFPLRLPGLVHVANRVRRYRAISLTEALDLDVRVDGHREVGQGLEVDLQTRVLGADGELIWESDSTMLARNGARRSGKASFTQPDLGGYEELAGWAVPGSIGRRYGWLAGDINPIHLNATLARLFGFPRAIAHGMGAFARCAGQLLGQQPADAVELDVVFKRPLLLPGEAVLLRKPDEPWVAFVLADPAREQRYLSGRLDLL
ncbi:MAG: hypothetical protein LAT50_00435 [Ectothiorhodospiraceae bacterium]|nr:hypothetical protein [Ectothiorhodospiraceae bacterium]